MEDFLSRLLAKSIRRAFRFSQEVLRWLYWPVRATQRSVLFVFDFVVGWWRSRELRRLLPGLPSVLIAIAAGYVAVAASFQDRGQTLQAYQRAAKSAMSTENYQSAKLYLERILTMQEGNNETLFDLARASQKTGDYPRMIAALATLAPDDRAVYAPAHLWQATRLLQQSSVTPDDLRRAEAHLLFAIRLRQDDVVARSVLGQMYFQQGLFAQAIPYLTAFAAADPNQKLLLGKAIAMTGDADRARRVGEEARDYAKRQSEAKPQDAELRKRWSDCCLFLEEYPQAAQLLSEFLKIQDKLELRQALAQVYVAWADSIKGDTPEAEQRRFDLLAAGVVAYPDEFSLYDRLSRIIERGSSLTTVRDFLLSNIVQGRAVGLSHLLLGSIEFKSEHQNEAKLHLQRAMEALPNADLVANNLAWLLIQSEPKDPERALQLINLALEKNPDAPRYHDTRGHILVVLDRPREAIDDLERALVVLNKNAETHRALAKAYAAIGLADLAEKHQAFATKLSQSTTPSPVTQ